MAYDRLLKRRGFNMKDEEPVTVEQYGWLGVNSVDSIYAMAKHHLPNTQNVDLGNPVGNITKVLGREALFASLGAGQVLGLHAWEHPDGDKLIKAWDKNLYLLSGASGSIAKTSQADWETGTRVNIDTTTSAGDMKLSKTGTDFSETDTLTADFNGTHSNTVAASNAVILDTSTDTNTKLLLHCDGANGGTTFTDESGKTVTPIGTAQTSTAQKKFGTASCLLDGGSDYLRLADSTDWAFGTGDFTIDLWVFLPSLPSSGTSKTLVCQGTGTTSYLKLFLNNTSGTYYLNFDVVVVESIYVSVSNTITLSTNTWTHLALVRSGNNFYMFKDGTQIGTTATDSSPAYGPNEFLYIGSHGASDYFYGYLDEIRISKGIARWTANFTPPTSAYNITGYALSGTYTHTVQNISGIGTTTGVTVTFNKTTPANTAITFQTNTSTDGGLTWGGWTTRASGDTIIPSGTDVSNYRVQWRATLTTTDNAATPSLDDVTLAGNTGYYTTGSWISIALDMANTPLTAVLSWVQTTPAGTTVTWYAQGSGGGTVFGDLREITVSGGAIPLQRYSKVKILLTGTVSATPTVSSLLINYSTSYTQANLLDISPLGRVSNLLTGNRVSMEGYEDRCYCADGLRPFVLYVDDATAVTGTAQQGTANTIRLAAGASAVNDCFNNAFVTITGGAGAGQVRFISDYNGTTKDATVSVPWTTNPDPDQYTKLLLHMDGSDNGTSFTDVIGKTVTRNGDTCTKTGTKKFGTASAYFDGTGDYLSLANSADWNFGTGDFTIDLWVNPSTINDDDGVFWLGGTDANYYLTLAIYSNRFYRQSPGGVGNFGDTLTADIWYHVAVVRYGNNLYWFVNGVLKQTDDLTGKSVGTSTDTFYIGTYTDTAHNVHGYIDEFRVSKGIARWTSSFTPPTEAYPDASTYSINSAVKVRNVGVDPPTTAPTLADSGTAGSPNGAYLGKYTFVNADGYESNPSAASASVSVSSKKITWTVPVDASAGNTTATRKLYRTKAGGSVYYYVATISDNTTTAYTDNIADSALTTLMLDNNNAPPSAVSLIYPFLTYMFYASGDELWFSKASEPENVPNITGDIQVIICPSTILDIKSNPMALIPQGNNFIAPITTNSGFVFDSDPTVDTTTMRVIDKNGCTSAWASDICISPDLRSILVFPTNTGVRSLLPGLQEESIESIPLSRNVQPYFDRAVNREQMAGIFFNGYYLISFEYLPTGAAQAEKVMFACDFRTETREWYGPWTRGASCYTISGNVLYSGDPALGIVYREFTGSSDNGANIKMIADLQILAPAGEKREHEFDNFVLILSADSDTTSLVCKPKINKPNGKSVEKTIAIGAIVSDFTGDIRPGDNVLRSKPYRIPSSEGNSISYRFVDDSTNPVSILKVITTLSVLPMDD